ncbi:phosphotriesterase-related protein [Bacillus canaveralius]|uniref:Phosphotriesterase-related protein n=1 Tax=Bacillus canaveralius TaxID=1403243 RepID=A0A2N5GMA8_9BACI|nr:MULTISPECIES: phosphotriesterase [Bacillus]PLR80605.1 phosphotriesterase-related protein [Bacillus sp. V33-4]PLR82954.1 phosphotriesterase-related protein [Bacillus canaveralius]PLR97041.1 phosphotriesterase-related protein [Bacillus canaveralius]
MKIQTVTGPVDPQAIHKTMIHEHLVFDLSEVRQEKDRDSKLEDSPQLDHEIQLLIDSGCNTIVEVSNIGMGRDAEALSEIAHKHDLNIVASTGFYKESVYPSFVFEKSKEELAEIMIREVLEGMDETTIRAGLIAEIGSSYEEITKTEEKVFQASILAHKTTGAPISTHCEIGTMGRDQLDIFEKHHVDMNRVSFGHQDLNEAVEEQLLLLKSGAYIQFDTIGKNSYRKDTDKVDNLLVLIERGYEDQLMLSCDITRKSHLKGYGGYGYNHLFENFIPALIEKGITNEILDKMLVHNPRKFLAFL